MAAKTVLAIDVGAESGRVMAVKFNGTSLEVEEISRFPNRPIREPNTLYWDVLDLWQNIEDGIQKGMHHHPASLGVDTWGVDFALLDAQGVLLGSPVHYRDSRTDGMMDRVFEIVPRTEVFRQTGIQIMPINTLYQLMSMVVNKSPLLDAAETFLTIPDLLNYWLTGAKVCEYSNATTTQLFNTATGHWAVDMLCKLNIPVKIFPEVVKPGTSLGVYKGIPVIAPATHDTGSAVAGIPARQGNFGYISSGTWSLAGIEIDKPIITLQALAANLTNEGGVLGSFRLLKNIMGLWIVQQCRATWQASGIQFSYPELVKIAETAPPLRSIVNPNDEAFLAFGHHPSHIASFCSKHNQPVPHTAGETIRTVLESLALAYRDVFETLEAVSGRSVDVIHIIGGGSENTLLNQMTADATGKRVVAGPVEATVIGNAIMQLISLGELRDLQEARQLIAIAAPIKSYEPNHSPAWEDAFQRYKSL